MGTIVQFVHFAAEEKYYKKKTTHFMTRGDGYGLGTSSKLSFYVKKGFTV